MNFCFHSPVDQLRVNRPATIPPPRVRLFGGRQLLAALAAAASLGANASPRPEPPEWVFAINEGVSYASGESPRQSFRAIADGMGRATSTHLRLDAITDYAVLERALRDQSLDIALVHPAHVSAAAVALHGYQAIAVSAAHAAYRPYFLCRPTLSANSVEEIVRAHQAVSAKPIGLPTQNSITSVMARAQLGDVTAANKAAHLPAFKYTRYQDAVVSMIEYGFVDCSVTGAKAIADGWKASGGKVIPGPYPAPVKVLLVNPRKVSPEAQTALRHYLLALPASSEGKQQLDRIGLPQGFAPLENRALLDAHGWLQRGLLNAP